MGWDAEYFKVYGHEVSAVRQRQTPIGDQLDAFSYGDRLATFHGQAGGEWDTLRAFPLRQRQRLAGAGWLKLHGEKPDVFADILVSRGLTADDPIEWYLRNALQAIPERQRWANIERHQRVAQLNGHRSYYEHRTAYVQSLGYPSIWHYRQARRW